MSEQSLFRVLAALLLSVSLLTACRPASSEAILEGLDAMNFAMGAHLEEPERLLSALEESIARHQPKMRAAKRDFEAMSPEQRLRALGTYEQALRERLETFLVLNYEIQARLEARPELHARYLALLRSIQAELKTGP